jgi:hypothetical protein
MRTYLHLLTAACLGASALLLSAPVSADDVVVKSTSVTVDQKLTLPPGISAKDLNADKAIEKVFKGVTDDAMSKTGFDNLVSYLVVQDKDRIKKSTDKSLTNLDGNNNKHLTDLIASLEGKWKSKYNQNFSMDYSKVFTSDFLQIATGEVNDPALLAGNWPAQPVMGMGASAAGTLTPGEANVTKDKTFGGEIKLEKGRDIGLAHISASHGMPGLTASLIHEHVTGWHFDIPNNINAQMLYDNLVDNLSFIDTHHDMLPADVNDGYREVSHAVVAALYGVDLQKMPMKGTAGER